MNEVFVLGAGASKALADLPLGNELIWSYHRDCTLARPIINGIPDNTQDDKKFAELGKFLVLAGEIYPELVAKVKEFEKRGMLMFTPIVNDKKHFADDILKVVQENGDHEGTSLINKLIFKHIEGAIRGGHDANKGFIEKVLINKETYAVSIISFNFDYLLKDYYDNGIDEGIYFDYLLEFDCILKNGYKYKRLIPLIKLHGSLDWGLCKGCNKLFLYFPHQVGRYYFGEGWSETCSCGSIIEPYIFLPHQKEDERINLLWNKAEDVLRNADKITIIGYSFPQYDEKAVNIFKNSLQPNVNLEIVDYCEKNKESTLKDLNNKYNQLFPRLENKIQISLDGYKKYLDSYI